MSSLGKTPGGNWRVRWREASGQRSRTFDTRAQAGEFQQYVDSCVTPSGPLEDPGPWIVYRAYRGVLPLGLYNDQDDAMAHCLDDAQQQGDNIGGAAWIPIDDNVPDGEQRLLLPAAPSSRVYTVIPLELSFRFDPGAEG